MKTEAEPSIMTQMWAIQKQQEVHLRITLEFGLFMLLLGTIFFIRLTNLGYNTLFIDEAINAVVGKDLLAGVLDRQATTFHFGSYLYPLVAGIMAQIGGVVGLRLAAAVTNCIAVIFVYLTTRSLFGKYAALLAMFFFGLTAGNVNLGQLAVYDSLAIPFLALTLFCLVMAVGTPQREQQYLLGASLALVLTVLSKYIGLIYIPALGLTAFALYIIQGRSFWQTVRQLTLYFIAPAFLILTAYGLYYYADLRLVATQQGYAWAERSLIARNLVEEMWMVLLPAVVGLVLLLVAIWFHNRETPPYFHRLATMGWPARSKSALILPGLFLALLILTWLAAPVYHMGTHNIRSLWKNVNYSLIFLAPLAGYCVATLINYNRRRDESARLLGLAVTLVLTFLFVDHTLDNNWAFHRSWPNATGVVNYLQASGLDASSHVLAEGMDTYQYYLDLETAKGKVWTSVWYVRYGDLYGLEAMQQAIHDHYFDYVIFEGYYEATARDLLLPTLTDAGYILGYEESQSLRTGGSVLVQVFVPGD